MFTLLLLDGTHLTLTLVNHNLVDRESEVQDV